MKENSVRFLPVILMFIMVPSFIEVDIMLPGFPEMGVFFNSSAAAVQWTLVANFIGLAALTLIYGPLSDVIGRKKVLIIGCCLFLLGSIGCMLAHTLYLLYAFRFGDSEKM